VPVTGLCRIAEGIAGFFAEHRVRTCGDRKRLPISALARRFANPGAAHLVPAPGHRVHVVTVEPKLEDAVHKCWPRIMNG
jgi:hypothetical protein